MKRAESKLLNEATRKKRANQMLEAQRNNDQCYLTRKAIDDQVIEYHDQKSFKENYDIAIRRGRTFVCSIDILQDPKLSSNAKVLFMIISCLSLDEGYCYASNVYLGEKMGKKHGAIDKYLNELEQFGLIGRDTYETKLGKRRNTYIQFQNFKDRYFTKPKESKAYKIPKRKLGL